MIQPFIEAGSSLVNDVSDPSRSHLGSSHPQQSIVVASLRDPNNGATHRGDKDAEAAICMAQRREIDATNEPNMYEFTFGF